MFLRGRVTRESAPLITQLDERLWYPTEAVGLSVHGDGSPHVGPSVRLISPLAATYAGLSGIPARSMHLLWQGRARFGPDALIKIGPKGLSWTSGDGTEHRIPASHIIPPGWSEFARYTRVGGPRADGFDVLGNAAWVRMARYVRATDEVPIDLLTNTMLSNPEKFADRTIVSRLCWAAMNRGDEASRFGESVSKMMAILLGRAIAYVARLTGEGRILVQYNAIAAVCGMPAWTVANTRLVQAMRRPQRLDLPTVLMLDTRSPETAEVTGAYQLTIRMV
jgi:hypothetical protein